MSAKESLLSKHDPDEEERSWAREGEDRLADFDRDTAVCHEDAWRSESPRRKQLARILSHQGKFELDIDQEELERLRSTS